jgi:hypothetical protein
MFSLFTRSIALLVILFLLAMLSLGMSGCAVVDDGQTGTDTLPWNSPAGWERSTIGLPY